jgi:hypothetical protein
MKKKNLLLTLVASLGIVLTSIGQVPNYIPTNGLVGWWPFNGNANDESGNGNNGIVNGATLSNDRTGNAISAYSFDGTNDRIEVAHNSNLNFGKVTVSLWFKANTYLTSDNYGPHLLSKREASGWGNSIQMNLGYIENQNACWADWSISGNGGIYYYESSQLNTLEWFNVVYTHDDQSVNLYLNGNLVKTMNSPGLLSFNSLPLWFGARPNSVQFFDGIIDDIAIWNRVLTQEEVNILYATCTSDLVLTQPTDQNTTIGNNVIFTTTANDQDATFQWQSDLGLGFQDVSNVGQYSGATTNELTVSNVSANNNNQPFRCIISSSACNDTTNLATLTVGTTFLDENTLNSIKISPNPTNDFIFVEGNTTNEDFQIIDIKGTVLITTNSNKIDLKKLSSGQYFLKQGSRYSKFIKE